MLEKYMNSEYILYTLSQQRERERERFIFKCLDLCGSFTQNSIRIQQCRKIHNLYLKSLKAITELFFNEKITCFCYQFVYGFQGYNSLEMNLEPSRVSY